MKQKPISRRKFVARSGLAAAGTTLGLGSLATGGSAAGDPSLSAGFTGGPGPGRLTINVFSKHLQFLEYEEMAEATAETGADGVDLVVRPGGHVLPENVERDLPRASKAIRDAGLELDMITTAITDAGDPFTERILKTASEQGIRFYRMGWYRVRMDADVAKRMEDYRSKLEKLADMNRKYRIHGAYQNHAGNYFGAPVWDLWYLIRDLDPEWTGCQYDIRHATVEGANSWHMGMEMLKDHIRCMVIKDFHWELQDGRWRIKNVPVGEGMVDFKAYFDRVVQFGIQGPISLHVEYPVYPDEEAPVSAKRAAAVNTIRTDVESLQGLLPQSG